METSTDKLERLVSVSNELRASAIVNLLEDHGIRAKAVGGHTSGFKAEAPGSVDILVMSDDLEQASAVLGTIEETAPRTDGAEMMMVNDVENLSDESLPVTQGDGMRRTIIYIGLVVLILSLLLAFVLNG